MAEFFAMKLNTEKVWNINEFNCFVLETISVKFQLLRTKYGIMATFPWQLELMEVIMI